MPLSTKIRKSTSTEATLLLLRLQLSRSIKNVQISKHFSSTFSSGSQTRLLSAPPIFRTPHTQAVITITAMTVCSWGGAQLSLHSMTIEYCHSYCTDQGYTTLGVEDSNQCFSAKYVSYTPISFDGCTYACDGNKDRDM